METFEFVSLMKKRDYKAVYKALVSGFNPNNIYYWTVYHSNDSPDGYGCSFDDRTYPVEHKAKILDLLGDLLNKDPAMEKLLRSFGATTEQEDNDAAWKKIYDEQQKQEQERMELVDKLLAQKKMIYPKVKRNHRRK